jgi:hypothetical protein
MVVKKYSAPLGAFVQQTALVYANDWSANAAYDASGGGKNIPAGSTYTQYNVTPESSGDTQYPYNNTYTLQVFERLTLGATVVTGDNDAPVFVNGNTFTIQTSTANSTTLTSPVTVTLGGTTVAAFIQAVSAANVPGVSASVNSDGYIVFTQSAGGVIVLQNTFGTPVAAAGFTNAVTGCRNSVIDDEEQLLLSGWVALDYVASPTAIDQDPADGRYWYYSATNQVDIMIQGGTGWLGYRNETNDVRGDNLSLTDPNGP